MEYRKKYKVYTPQVVWLSYVTKLLRENPSYYYIVRDRAVYSYPANHIIDVKNTITRKKAEASILRRSKTEEDKQAYILLKDQINNMTLYYKEHKKSNEPIKIIDQTTYTSIISSYFDKAADEFVNTGKLFFSKGLGYIYAHVIKRTPGSKLKPDWGESNKNKKKLIEQGITPQSLKDNIQGEKWMVYHDAPFYVKISWRRSKHSMMNFYKFIPTKSRPGLYARMLKKVRENPVIINQYKKR